MTNTTFCAFCNHDTLNSRKIRTNKLSYSFVSSPWFREGHCLVVPNRHITNPSELTPSEASEILLELGRLSSLLDEGYGTGIMQKYQPLQRQNEVKQDHLHFHVFPRQKEEDSLFPVPTPNDFSAFYTPTEIDISSLVKKLSQ